MTDITLIGKKFEIENKINEILGHIVLNPGFDRDLIEDFVNNSRAFLDSFTKLVDRAEELENE